jgi:hypothetical protein
MILVFFASLLLGLKAKSEPQLLQAYARGPLMAEQLLQIF